MLENIIALISAIAPIAGSAFILWRRFVARDMLIRKQENELALAEQKATRLAQTEQNELLTKIIGGGEASLEAVIGVINTFTQANAARDILHSNESKRHDDLLATLNQTIESGQVQHSNDLQALTKAITIFGNKVNEVVEGVGRIETTVNKTADTIDDLSFLVKNDLLAIKDSLGTLSESNGKLVTQKQVAEIQTLFERKVADIMELLKSENISHINLKKKGKEHEPTQPISADL